MEDEKIEICQYCGKVVMDDENMCQDCWNEFVKEMISFSSRTQREMNLNQDC